jgi:HEPN superfamily RES-like protein/RES domain-containing protein
MGREKNRWIELGDAGPRTRAAEKFVCMECFTDPSLKSVVEDAVESKVCTFCGRQSDEEIAAPLESIAEHVLDCLHQHYDEAANCLPFESAEGGYQGETFDADGVLYDAGLEDCIADGREALLAAISAAVDDGTTWCERDPFELRQHQSWSFSWRHFCDFIKHERRFFFLGDTPDYAKHRDGDGLVGPASILQTIVKQCLDLGLVKSLPGGTRVYRARRQTKGRAFRSALDLGPPPADCAVKSNRMSAPGIAMAYLADDDATALLETGGYGRYAVAEFELSREVTIVDLTCVPPAPSIFAQESRRDALIFLRDFANDVSKPIAGDDRIHVEYVPTQVITEYFRVAPELRKRGVQGLRYASAQREGGICIALFGGRELLVLAEGERSKLPPEALVIETESATCLRLVRAYSLVKPSPPTQPV